MTYLFGVAWLVLAIIIAVFIQGSGFKNKLFFKIGLLLILLSFICGFGILVAAISII